MPGGTTPAIPTFQGYSQFHLAQWRQRIVHTQTFKLFEYGEGFARQVELMVDEVGSMGHSCLRSLEHFFYGIFGYVKDKRGMSIHGWRQALRIANYWRRHFGVPEEQEPEPSPEETPPRDHENTDADAASTTAMPPQPHIQVNQLAWSLHDRTWLSMPPSCKPSKVLIQPPRRLPLLI